MGYGSEPSYSYSATDTAYRKLQAVLDDYVSAKAYGVMGNGVDDTFNINAMLLNIYTTGNTVDYRRSIFFPAGQYNINSNGIYLPMENMYDREKIIANNDTCTMYLLQRLVKRNEK